MATALTAERVNGDSTGRIGLGWHGATGRWTILTGGVLILAIGPAVWRALHPDNLATAAGWIIALAFGCAVGSAAAPPIVLAICATLNWRPAWQRFLLFTPALALQAAALVLCWSKDNSLWRGSVVVAISPLIVLAAASPAFLFRLWRQWMIVPRANPAVRSSASIASLLLITTFWAAAAASTQWINTSGWFEDSALDDPGQQSTALLISVVLFVLMPAAFIGLALLLSLRATLIRSAAQALFAAAAVLIATLAIAIGSIVLFLYLVGFQVNDRLISGEELLVAALAVGAFCATTFVIGLASFFTLRLLGYRLVHRTSDRESC